MTAYEEAEAAADKAGVVVRELTEMADLTGAVNLLADIWGRRESPPVTAELLRAFSKAGNYVTGAYDADRLVGACVAFFHEPAGSALHSHIAGVSADCTGRGIGFALKLHQRAWALDRDVAVIAWTFDPLVARNAYFNLGKLGARPVEYLPNFYGPMTDAFNGHEDSDRLLVHWALRDDSRLPDAPGAPVVLEIGADGGPVAVPADGAVGLVAVPPDIGVIRATDPALARRWRLAVRDALTSVQIDGFDSGGHYVVRREP
ncbi:GNAT family N-acetyltransferase [Cryptosporangium phraense]|uniref:GNAT family N-acetyltransferase n=1 Tax=Cryptosporangium phraense TaxID=2593070 RepID=A0A545AZT5_9ACTN|nr:GNAT family N-acetyltransferase [Cryptosporangium phraense]TQS46832.1 GNAT family N-acetyltransferase [Cryptosporangium phraense]